MAERGGMGDVCSVASTISPYLNYHEKNRIYTRMKEIGFGILKAENGYAGVFRIELQALKF